MTNAKPAPKIRCNWLVCAFILLISLSVSGEPSDEYSVKAVFLYNFAKFIDWPSPPDPSGITICILGEDPFGSVIDVMATGKSAGGQRFVIRRLKEAAEARSCRIVFVGRDEKNKTAKLIEAVKGAPVLTVGEGKEFLRLGGMIELSMKEDHLAVGISQKTAEMAGLKISAKLLTLSHD